MKYLINGQLVSREIFYADLYKKSNEYWEEKFKEQYPDKDNMAITMMKVGSYKATLMQLVDKQSVIVDSMKFEVKR